MSVKKDLCVIHANCQAEPLMGLLALSPEFSGLFSLRHYTNYLNEEPTQGDLDECAVFLYQHLGPEWGEQASDALLARLNPSAQAICLPNVFFKGYWPFWTSKSPIDFGDSLLDKLIDSGAQKPEIIKIYCQSDLGKFVNIKAVAAESLLLEEEKEKRSPIKTAALVREFWQREFLFYTCNHPGKRILGSIANQFLRLLGLPELPGALIDGYSPEYANFELPIHPQVAAALELGFIAPEQKFRVFERELSFLQYVSRYIDCRQQGYDEAFLGYLQIV